MTMQNPSFDTIASDTEEIQRRNSAPSTASGWGEIGTKKQAQDPTNFSVMSYGPDASKPGYSSAAGVQYGPLDPKADKTHVIGLGDASSIVDKVFGGPQIRKYVSDPLIGATYGAIAAPIRAIQGKPQPSTSLNPWTQANANFRAAPTAVKVVGEMFTDPRNYALGELGAGFGGLGAGTGKGAAMELGAKATGRDRAFIGNDLGKLGMKGVSGASDELPKPLPDWYQHTPGQPLDDSDKFARRATWDVTSPTPRTPTVKEAESVRGQTGQLLASYPDSPTILARRGEVEAFLATQGKGDIGWARRDIEAARKFWETVYGGLKTSPEYERSIINAEVALSEAEKQLGIVPKAPVTPSANAHIGNIRPPIPPSVPSAAGTMPPLGGLGAGTGKGAAMELGAKMTEENWGRIGSDLAPIAGKATQPVANVLDTLERTLAMNSKNKGFAQQFVSKNITPAFVQRFGDSPFMDLERQANGEWLLGIKTAGWESRVKDMGLTFVRKGDFQSLYRIPAAADLGDSLTKNLALPKGAAGEVAGAKPPPPIASPVAAASTQMQALTDRLGQAYQEHALPRAAIEQAKGESRAAKAASMRDVYATQGGKQAYQSATASLAGADIPQDLKTIQPRSFFTPEEQNALHDLVIQKGDPAKPFDIRNNQATLEKIFNGEVVTDKEIEKMSNVLPADVIDILMKKNMSSAGRAWYTAKDLARTPGAILTSGATHFSAVLRTGGFGTTAHPTEAGPALVNMFKSFGSMENTVAIEKGLHLDTPSFLNERGGQTLLEQIKAHPDPAEADAATQALNKAFSKKLVTSDEASAVSKVLGKDVGNGILDTQWRTAAQRTSLYDAPIAGSGGSLVKQDEAALGLAGKRLVDRIPVMGRVIKASSRSYSVYLNDLRDGMFSTLAQGRFDAGQPYNSKGLSDLARYVNRATGRGSLGPLEEQAPLLNAIFFSPRFALSRIQAPYTVIEPGMTNAVRLQAAQDVAKFAAVWGGAITMASMLGAKVEHDHRSSDFGKIHVGNTRLDVLAGFLPEARLAMDIVSGHRGLNPLVGQKKTLGAGAIYDQAKAQSTLQYLRNKLSPVAALTADGVTGTNPIGEEFQATGAGVANQAYHRLTPILVQSINDSVQGNQGEKRGVIGLPSALGIGVQTFRSQTDALNEKSQQMFGKPFADLPATTGNQQKQQVVEALTSGGYYPKNYSKPTQARLNTEKVIEQDFLGGKVYPTGTALRTDLSKVQLLAASVASQSPIASSTATSHQGKVLQGWYDTYKQSKAGQQGLDTQKLDTLQQNYMNSLSQDDKTFLQNNINLAPHSPVIQRLEDLRRTLQDVNYYNRAVFASQQNIDLGNGQKYNDLPVATKALFAQYEAAGASKDWQTKHVIANPTYGAANVSELVKLQAIVDTAKTDWAAKNPMIDAGLTIFYDKPPHTPEAKAAIAFPMADGGTARLSPERQLSVLTVQDSKGKDVPISETAIASLYTAVAAKAHADGISPLEEFAKANPGGNASMAALVDQAKQVVAARGK